MKDDFKQDLLQHVTYLDDLVTEHFRQMEEDEDIPEENYREYEKQIDRIFIAIDHLREDIHLT
jgi:hypothetical protein